MAYAYKIGATQYLVNTDDTDVYGPGWAYVEVPTHTYGDDPIGFLVPYVKYHRNYSYDDNFYDLRRRRRMLDTDVQNIWTYIPPPRRHVVTPSTRPVQRASYKEYLPVTMPEYDNRPKRRHSISSHSSTLPRTHALSRYARQLRFESPRSWTPVPSREDEFSINVDLKTDSLNRALLRRDMETALRSIYANKGRSEIRSGRAFNLAELRRLDRKQDQLSKYLLDFKRDMVRAKHPSQFRKF